MYIECQSYATFGLLNNQCNNSLWFLNTNFFLCIISESLPMFLKTLKCHIYMWPRRRIRIYLCKRNIIIHKAFSAFSRWEFASNVHSLRVSMEHIIETWKSSEELGVNGNCFKENRRDQSSKELAPETKNCKSRWLFICLISSHSMMWSIMEEVEVEAKMSLLNFIMCWTT